MQIPAKRSQIQGSRIRITQVTNNRKKWDCSPFKLVKDKGEVVHHYRQ